MKIKETTKQSLLVNAKRVIELIEREIDFEKSYYSVGNGTSELKNKMRELRRETLKLEKEMREY